MKTRVFAVCVVVFLFCGITHAGLSDGLVAYYPFNGNANDESGNGNNGKEYGGVTYGDGITGKAASFDGKMNEYILISDSASLSITTSLSICSWVNSKFDIGQMAVVTKGYNKEDYTLWAIPDGIGLLLNWNTSEQFSEFYHSGALSKNTWYFLTATYDGQKVKFYINGKIKAEYNFTHPVHTSHEALYIGSSYPGSYEVFSGRIDELRIYNRAISESEIQQLYQSQSTCSNDIVTFTAGAPAKAAEVNANFDTLNCQIQVLNSQLQALKAIVCKNDPTASVCQ